MKKCPKCGKAYEDTNTLCPNDGSALVKSGDRLVGETLAGKYRVEERISEGGMGTVYRGTHVLMEKTVAIKVLHPSLAADEKIVARFTREARAASRISHPHALNVTDFGEAESGVVFLIMEYLRGQTLKQVIRTEGPMALSRAAEITRQVAGALDAAHAEGVVHRDLKSDNIMLSEDAAGDDWAKVLDFGIAKIQEPDGQDPELTAPNLIIGTPQYMSPEQCSQASEIDARSDIYSLGVIVFEMLTGHVPFTGESATAIMLKHLQEPPPSLTAERPDLSPETARVVTRALSKRPEDRQQSAGELSEALAAAAAQAPAGTAENRPALDRDTHRIVVPTSSTEPRATVGEEYDEATVVRATPRAQTGEQEIFEDIIEPPPAASFNPWKVLVPAAAVLVALLGIFFVVSSNSGAPANDNSNPLAADPSALPVQAATPPTGSAESGFAPGQPLPAATVAAQGAVPGAQGATAPADAQPSPATPVDPKATPTLVDESKGNRNDNRAQEEGEEGEDPPPPANSNRQRSTPQPTPTRESGEDPPPPTPRKTATPPPTPPPAAPASTEDPPPPQGR